MRMRAIGVAMLWAAAACGDSASEDGQAAHADAGPFAAAERVSGEPRKVGDVRATGAAGEARVPLHLYLSNQSFDPPTVDIQVWIEETHVVGGDFPVEGQHNFVEFEVQVPPGALHLHAEALDGQVVLDERIEVPAERFGYLDFWYYPDEDDAPELLWNLRDEFVPFL